MNSESRIVSTAPAWARTSAHLPASGAGERREIIGLAVLFALFRIMVPAWFQPFYSEFRFFLYPFMALSNPEFMAGFGGRTALPFLDYWLEYPPLFPWVAVCVHKLHTLVFGGAVNPQQAILFSRMMAAVMALADLGNLLLIYAIARRIRGHAAAIRACVIYALLFFTLVAGNSYFDTFVLFTILLALWAMTTGCVKLAGSMAGLGFMLKFIPLFFLPVGIKYAARLVNPKQGQPRQTDQGPMADGFGVGDRRPDAESTGPLFTPPPAGPASSANAADWNRLITYFGVFVLTVGALSVPFMYARGDLFVMPFRVALNRPGWETLRALAGGHNNFGSVQPTPADVPSERAYFEKVRKDNPKAVGFLAATQALGGMLGLSPADRLRIASRFTTDISYLKHGNDPLMLPVIVILAAFYGIVWFCMRREPAPLNIVALSGVSVFTLLLASHGWSPQFIVYVIPFLLLAFPTSLGVVMCVVATVINFLEMPVWLGLNTVKYGGPDEVEWLLWLVVILRSAFLVIASLMLFLTALAQREPAEESEA